MAHISGPNCHGRATCLQALDPKNTVLRAADERDLDRPRSPALASPASPCQGIAGGADARQQAARAPALQTSLGPARPTSAVAAVDASAFAAVAAVEAPALACSGAQPPCVPASASLQATSTVQRSRASAAVPGHGGAADDSGTGNELGELSLCSRMPAARDRSEARKEPPNCECPARVTPRSSAASKSLVGPRLESKEASAQEPARPDVSGGVDSSSARPNAADRRHGPGWQRPTGAPVSFPHARTCVRRQRRYFRQSQAARRPDPRLSSVPTPLRSAGAPEAGAPRCRRQGGVGCRCARSFPGPL